MSYLLDTNICIALLKGTDRGAIARLRAADPAQVFLCSVVKAELLYGARKSRQVESNLALLGKFFGPFESLPFDDRCAELYGMTRALLAKAGTPIGANDLLIASIAQGYDMTLVTRNHEEFRRVPGLRVESW